MLAERAIGQILETSLWFAGAILAGALVVYLFQRWQRKSETAGDSVHDQLARFRLLYEEGEMSEEEYQRVHALLAGHLEKKGKPATPEASAESPKEDQRKETP